MSKNDLSFNPGEDNAAPDSGDCTHQHQKKEASAKKGRHQTRKAAKRPKKSPGDGNGVKGRDLLPNESKNNKGRKPGSENPSEQNGGKDLKDSGDTKSPGPPQDLQVPEDEMDSKSLGGSRRGRYRGSGSKPSSKSHDPGDVAQCAWKIYLSEIREEGVSLMDDKSAKELARRCFELATIFLDEEQKQS